jgi:hypothetical protein
MADNNSDTDTVILVSSDEEDSDKESQSSGFLPDLPPVDSSCMRTTKIALIRPSTFKGQTKRLRPKRRLLPPPKILEDLKRREKQRKIGEDFDLKYPPGINVQGDVTYIDAPVTTAIALKDTTYKASCNITRKRWDFLLEHLNVCIKLMFNTNTKMYIHGLEVPSRMAGGLNESWTVTETMTEDGMPMYPRDTVLAILEMVEKYLVKEMDNRKMERGGPRTTQQYVNQMIGQLGIVLNDHWGFRGFTGRGNNWVFNIDPMTDMAYSREKFFAQQSTKTGLIPVETSTPRGILSNPADIVLLDCSDESESAADSDTTDDSDITVDMP